MKSVTILLASLMLAAQAAMGAAPARLVTIQSSSGQFWVTGFPPAPPNPALDALKTPPNLVHLDASELSLTCERIKKSLLFQLGLADKWQGNIQVAQHANMKPDDEIVVATTRFQDGWKYSVHMPDLVDREKLVRAIVQAVLQEVANRNSPERSIEVPLWLKDGLAMMVMEEGGLELIAQAKPAQRTFNTQFWVLQEKTHTEWRTNVLGHAHARLKTHAVLSFSDLSMPLAEQVTGEGWKDYEASAQVFVAELLKLERGQARLRKMFELMPNYFNPQLAFLNAFQGDFKNALEVEKWWSLSVKTFLSRDVNSKWPDATVLDRLTDILQASVEIRTSTNALPTTQAMPLQKFIQELDYARQKPALNNIMVQLQTLEWSVPPDLLRLIYDYHRTLLSYVQRREKAKNSDLASARLIVRETVNQLNLLDTLRQDFKQYGINTPQNAQTP